jgi:hypothetical protein
MCCEACYVKQHIQRWGKTNIVSMKYHLPRNSVHAARDISSSHCRFHPIFGYVVTLATLNSISKDEAKPTLWAWNITCRCCSTVHAARAISSSRCWFHPIFGYVVTLATLNNICKDAAKPTSWAWNITCRVIPSTRHVLYLVLTVGFTPSLDMLWRLIR